MSTLRLWFSILLLLCHSPLRSAQLGDLDGDGVATVRDLAIVVGHKNETRVLPAAQAVLADLNGDGAVNQADADEVVFEILGTRAPQELPLATLRRTSPGDGEGDVALTRETILHFSLPLGLGASISTIQFYAEFGGKRILSRAELSSDRKKATLFYLQPLPSSARVNVYFNGAGLTDLLGRPLDADGDSVTGGVARVQFDTLSVTPVAQTGIRGRVFASERATGGIEVPLAGVTVTVDGAEETLRTVTDAQGNFQLTPCPAGSFFVHVDGRTSPQSSYPSGNYYPSVGKRWHAEPGRTDNLAGNEQDVTRGDIYLPLIKAGTLAPVSATQDVTITNPDLPGAFLVVPANSLFSDDGTRGGAVGMAPVAPDRIPSPLPPGLNLPLVVTIQTSGGLNFDRPVPICLPNLPDPVTGQRLPPGAPSALWSFNHDLGDWEVVGPMTVTADGEFVKTDVGVGVIQPGWHGTQPGAQAEGAEQLEPKDPNCWPGAKTAQAGFSAMADCAMEFGQVNRWLKCGVTVAKGAATVAGLFGAEPPKDLQAVRNTSATVGLFSAGLEVLKDCGLAAVQTASPFSKLSAAITCGSGALDTLNTYLNDDAPPECSNGTFRNVVRGANTLVGAFNAARTLRNAIRDYDPNDLGTLIDFDKAALDAAKTVMDGVITAVELSAPGNPNPSLTPQQIQDIQQAQQQAVESAQRARDVTDAMAEMETVAAEIREGARQGADAAGDFLRETGKPSGSSAQPPIVKVTFPPESEGQQPVVIHPKPGPSGRITIIGPPDRGYCLETYNPRTQRYTRSCGFTGGNGQRTTLPPIDADPTPPTTPAPDADGDGLQDEAEGILGTNPANPDTDGDGISDGAEVDQGTNPLDGFIATTGIIASAPTSGPAVDVSAVNNVAAVACQTRGVTVFNVFSGLNPVRIAEIPVEGSAMAVSCAGNYVAAACLYGGLAVVDISDPRAPRRLHQVNLGASAQAVATDGLVAYVGFDNGQVAMVDLPTGQVLSRATPSGAGVEDVAIGPNHLYVLKLGGLHTVPLIGAVFGTPGTAAFAGSRGAGGQRLRLFLGEDKLYAVHTAGVQMYSLANPSAPVSVRDALDGQFGWKNLAANGSGSALAAADANSTGDGQHDVLLYDLNPNGTNLAFLARFPTPGLAAAVSIYNGLGYVADTDSGLHVISYRPFDSLGQAPAITLGSSFSLDHNARTGSAEEGKAMRLSASVTDDVQVRNVEFHLNGSLVVTDGNYPFEHRFITPAMTASNTIFTVRAKATDTGGNTAWTETYTLTLVPDATPPSVLATTPANGAFVGSISNLYATFSEQIDPSTLPTGLQVLGLNGAPMPSGGAVSYREGLRAAFLEFPSSLSPGQYQIRAAAPLADMAGNVLATPFTTMFRVYSFTDDDDDGVPDELEFMLGLSSGDNDSDNDGIFDGDEDFDGDNLSNRGEFVLIRDPRTRDTDGNGVWDGDEDGDLDSLLDGAEIEAGTDPAQADTDGDGFDDASELATGSDPLTRGGVIMRLSSAATSYLLPTPEGFPSGTSVQVSSPMASYLLASVMPMAANTPVSLFSPLVSYLLPFERSLPAAAPISVHSQSVSYENQ